MADVTAAADLNQRVPRVRQWPVPFISADLDQVPFERRKAAENRNH
jgi:hypothetical protein